MEMDNYLSTRSYTTVRQQTLDICQPLFIEDYIVQPTQEVSPPKWHLAHTTWFFEQFILKQFADKYQPFDPLFDELFNSYYKSVSPHWIQAKRGLLSRPTVKQVLEYRTHVDTYMRILLDSFPVEEVFTLTELGIHHEQQHFLENQPYNTSLPKISKMGYPPRTNGFPPNIFMILKALNYFNKSLH